MSLSSPIWLLALIPWVGVTLWLLWGRRRRVYVPFLELWKGPAAKPIEKSAIEPPPFWLAMALVALPLAVVSAARPRINSAAGEGEPITILVDRGMTMSARGATDLRYRELVEQAAPHIGEAFGRGVVELRCIPPAEPIQATRGSWTDRAKALPPTALDTQPLFRPMLMELLRQSDRSVVVLSDQDLGMTDPRVVQIRPQNRLKNIGIVAVAAREAPARQLMVRVRAVGWASPTTRMLVNAFEPGKPPMQPVAVNVNLPANAERDYFVDLPGEWWAVPTLQRPVLAVKLETNDDLPADNQAYLVREQSWPMLEPRAALPAELARMIDLYARLRPPAAGSKRVALVASLEGLPSNEPAAVLGMATSAAATTLPAALQVAEHPVTRSINWSSLKSQSIAATNLDTSWKPLVWAQGQTLVAIRETPARQAWVGIRPETWGNSPEFVIFWTNLFNWLGEGAESFASHPIAQLGPEWTCITSAPPPAGAGLEPGVYRRNDGVLRAVNALDVRVPEVRQDNWREGLAQLAEARSSSNRGKDITSLILLLALAAMLVAAATYRPQR